MSPKADAAARLVVRRAEDDETRAARLLLPGCFGPSFAPELWVAIDAETSLIVGAGAVAWRPISDPPGFPVEIHVLAALRRRGIGTALIAAIARVATGSARYLHDWFTVPEDGPAAKFLSHAGFVATRRLLEFQADGARFYAMVKSIHDRLGAAGKLPAAFRVVPLRAAPPGEVAALIAENFHEASASMLAGIARGAGQHDPDKSVVLLGPGGVRGALLYAWHDGEPVIEAWVVAAAARSSAAGLMMLEAATRNGLEAGARGFRFSCFADARDTVNLARRGGATIIATRARFTRVLPG